MSVGYLDRPAESGARLRSVFDSSPIGMAVCAPDGSWLRVNPVVTALLGYSEPELVKLGLAAMTHPDDRHIEQEHRTELLDGQVSSYQAQLRLLAEDGRAVPCLLAATLLRDDNGVPEQIFVQIVDRTAAVATREALLRSEAQFRAAFDASPLGAVMAGADGVIHRVNPSFEQLLGRPAADLIGHHFIEFTHPEDRTENERENQRVGAAPGTVAAFDKRYVRPDGGVIWARVSLTSIPGADGAVDLLLQCEDVTARKLAEQTAAVEAQRLRTTIAVQREVTASAADRPSVLRLMVDRALQVLPTGDSAVVLLIEPDGATLRAAAGTGALSAHLIPSLPLAGSLAEPAIATGVTVRTGDASADSRGNQRFSAATGTRSLMLAPLRTPHGSLGVLAVAAQHTDAFDDADEQQLTLLADALAGALRHADDAAHKQDLLARATAAVQELETERTAVLAALDRLARSEHRFAEVFEHSPVPKIVIGLRGRDRGRIQLANPAFLRLLGYSIEQLGAVQLPVLALTAADTEGERDGRPPPAREAELRRADGSLVIVAVHLIAMPDDQGPQSAVVQLLDVTAERKARADLARSEEQFRTAFDGCPIGLLIADEHGQFQQVNPAAAALAGLPREQMVNLTHRDVTDPADLDEATLGRLALLRGAHDVCYDGRLRRPDGTIVWTRVTLSLIPGPAGRRWRLVQLQDISAERAAAANSEREVQRLRATLAVQREVTAAAGERDAALRVVAERAVQAFDAADGSAVELVDGDDLYYQATAGSLTAAAGVRVRIQGSLSGRVLVTDAPAHCADTTDDPRVDRAACERLGIGSMLIAPLHADNRVIGCLKISATRAHVFDDTDEQQLALLADSLSSALRHADDAERNAELLAERTRALAALAASETRFRLAFDNSPLGLTLIGMADPDRGRYLQVNPAMSAITGYRADELTEMTYKDLLHPSDVPADEVVSDAITAGLAPYRSEMRYRHKDGHVVWVATAGAPVLDEHGRPLYVVSQVEDITAKRAADAELRRQARLLELIPAAVIVRDPDGTIRWWNAGAESLYGWPLSVAQGRRTHRLLATGFPTSRGAAEVEEGLDRDGHWAGPLEHLTADGRTVAVLSRQVLHRPSAGADPQVLEINTDVTAARAAEIALAESEQRFRAQFANSAAGQVIRSLDGSPSQVNPAYAAMLGYPPEVLVALPDSELAHPDDFAAIRNAIAGLFAGAATSYTHEGRLRHAAGHWVDASATISLVRDDAGRPKNIIGVVTDISARRAAERARDAAAAALSERNSELEAANQLKLDIIGMLGHEIGNPLQSIRGYAELLCDNPPALDEARRERAIDAISRQAGRLDEIVREVLAMVSIDAGTISAIRQELSLRAEVEKVLAATDLEHITIAGADARVLCHPGHLQQILVNLLSNAAKYGGGVTAMRLVGDGHGHASVQVEDSGPGVPEEFRPHLFERLTRADRDAASSVKGTGLGLYIVQGLAQANHGGIHHEPNPAGGSRFVVTLETVAFGAGTD
ncbi:PAS domain S-box protein [Actinoplanes sp. NPDC026619]|uniref:PAS domain S-box protein n=1 Tax=Actinoplanes sp. NPDC026619 TaxID=3155798 RepID=UPI0033C532CE